MANWQGMILTTKGRDLQAKVEAGKTLLSLTKIKLGNGVIGGTQTLEELTDLVSPKQIIGITTIDPKSSGICKITGTVTNVGLETGYNIKELGLFATDPTEGEILYAITTDSNFDYLQAEGGATVVSEEFNLSITISNTSQVTATIDATGLLTVSSARILISNHNTAPDAHADIRTLIEAATKKAGLPVGFEYTIPYTELQSGQLALLGGKYPKSTFADLWTWVQTHPSMIVTETEWQALKTASGGRVVPKYANVDDQYFRVPLMTVWERGASSLDEVGTYLEAGLPNITGSALVGKTDAQVATFGFSGAISKLKDYPGVYFGTGNQSTASGGLFFDASKSNPIYGKSAEVQPQSVCRLWVVQAYGTTSNTGNMDVSQVAQSITDLTGRVSTLEAKPDFTQSLTENGWCRMPNGLIFQWGTIKNITSTSSEFSYPIQAPTKCLAVIAQRIKNGSNTSIDGSLVRSFDNTKAVLNFSAASNDPCDGLVLIVCI